LKTNLTHITPTLRKSGQFSALLGLALLVATTASADIASGRVLPPTAIPLGWSIDDMAAAVANFSISGNDLAYYPDTPFQIVYRHPSCSITTETWWASITSGRRGRARAAAKWWARRG
jgi:hypothetical protein